jgi:hypothetical protein
MASEQTIRALCRSLREFHTLKLVLNTSNRGILPCLEWVPLTMLAFANAPSRGFVEFSIFASCVAMARITKREVCANISKNTLTEIDRLEMMTDLTGDSLKHSAIHEKLKRMDLKRSCYQRFIF